MPTEGRFMFGYNVTVTNLNKATCQLVSRTWMVKTSTSAISRALIKHRNTDFLVLHDQDNSYIS